MKAKELRSLLDENDNLRVTISNEWILTRFRDSLSGDKIEVRHAYNVDKWETFDKLNDGVRFFMSKLNYLKGKGGIDIKVEVRDKYLEIVK